MSLVVLYIFKSSFDFFQLVPYFIVNVLNYPGLPGAFLAVLFGGSLRYPRLYSSENFLVVGN
jgi:hypothetical protein